MLHPPDLQYSNLHEGPRTQCSCEVSIGSYRLFSRPDSLDLSIEPPILKCFHGTQDREASRVPGLHRGHERHLLARGERFLHRVHLIFGVIAVRRARCSQDWREERTLVS